MTNRKKPNVNKSDEPLPDLGELLSQGNTGPVDSFGDVDPNTLQRLTYSITAIGGFATYWYDSVNSRLCISLRLGNGKKSYNVDLAEQFDVLAEQICNQLAPALRKVEAAPPPPLPSTSPASKKSPSAQAQDPTDT